LTADTADALLGEGEKKGIKDGIDKEVVGAFDALNAKIQKAKTLLENLKNRTSRKRKRQYHSN
jgi:hypothetical protein